MLPYQCSNSSNLRLPYQTDAIDCGNFLLATLQEKSRLLRSALVLMIERKDGEPIIDPCYLDAVRDCLKVNRSTLDLSTNDIFLLYEELIRLQALKENRSDHPEFFHKLDVFWSRHFSGSRRTEFSQWVEFECVTHPKTDERIPAIELLVLLFNSDKYEFAQHSRLFVLYSSLIIESKSANFSLQVNGSMKEKPFADGCPITYASISCEYNLASFLLAFSKFEVFAYFPYGGRNHSMV